MRAGVRLGPSFSLQVERTWRNVKFLLGRDPRASPVEKDEAPVPTRCPHVARVTWFSYRYRLNLVNPELGPDLPCVVEVVGPVYPRFDLFQP